MQSVTDAGVAGACVAGAKPDANVGNIRESASTVHIDPGLSGRTAEVAGKSAPPQTPASAVRIEAKESPAAARPLSYADRSRHEGLVKLSIPTRLHLAELPVQLDLGTIMATRGNALLLQRYLDDGQGGPAVELFGAIGKPLCASQFQQDGLRLWQQVLQHMGDELSVRAGVAWLHAARLYDAAGRSEPAIQAYGQALAILGQFRWQLDSSDDIRSLAAARNRQDQLMPFERIRCAVEQALERGDVDGARKQLAKAMTRQLAPREQIQCLQMAGDIKAEQGLFELAVHYYQASVNRANEKPDEFKAEADEAAAKRDSAGSKLDPTIAERIVAACRGSQSTFDQLLLNTARQLKSEDYGVAARMLDGLIPRLTARHPPAALAALLSRRDISVSVNDGQTTRLNLKLANVYLRLGQSAEAALCLLSVFNDPKTTKWLPRGLQVAHALLLGRDMDEAAQWCQAAQARSSTSQDATTLEKHVTQMLLTAAEELEEDDRGAAAQLLDRFIPHLSRRGDMTSALCALLDRRKISAELQDGQTARFDLDLARAYLRAGERANAAYCLLSVLTDEKAMEWLLPSLKTAAPLFAKHGMVHAVQWCQAASKRQLVDEDRRTMGAYIGHVLACVTDDVVQQAAGGTFDPLLKHAQDLVSNGFPDGVPVVFKLVLSEGKDMDVVALEKALSDHVKVVTTPDQFNAISVRLRLALADLNLNGQDLPSAAENLGRALDMAQSDAALLGACLDCASRIADAAGDARNALYFGEAARLCDTGSSATQSSSADREQAQRRMAQLESKLAPEAVDAIRRAAVNAGSDGRMEAVYELIGRIRPR
jgi:tetratricopeptide (TPR) repeat protein